MKAKVAKSLVCLLALSQTCIADDIGEVQIEKFRFNEDYSAMRQAQRQQKWRYRLKNIALDKRGFYSLSVGGEVRQRFETSTAPVFDDDGQDKWGAWLHRYLLHADVKLGKNVRVFTQLYSAQESGRKSGSSPVDENTLEFQNAFVDFALMNNTESNLIVRAGRQELEFGSGRLIDTREGTNVRRSFNATRLIYEQASFSLNGFYGRLVNSEPSVFDDNNSDQRLWGLYATAKELSFFISTNADFYYLAYQNDDAFFEQGRGDETRHTIGSRLHGNYGNIRWNNEFIYQFGQFDSVDFGSADINAWSIASVFAYTFAGAVYSPQLSLSMNIASGDKDPDKPDLQTFSALYPRGNYFSQAAVLGPRNFYNFNPKLSLTMSPQWQVSADVNLFWRLEKSDGVYTPSGALLRASNGSDERNVGTAFSFQSEYSVLENLSFTAIYTHFFAGDFIKQTGPDDDIRFTEFTLQFRF